MKSIRFHVVLMLVVTAALASSAFAQSSATGTATANANIVPGISIVNNAALNFGDFLQPTTGGGTVTLTAAAPTTQTPVGVTPAGGTINAAQFTVTGAGTKTFGVVLPGSININSGGNSMAVNAFSSNCPLNVCTFGSVVAAPQDFVLYVGGTLTVANNQALGQYAGTFNVTVAYQ